MNPRHTLRRLAPLACILLLAACGQKGPLYLPDESATKVAPAPAAGAAGTPDRSNEPRKQIH
jgi:predicted small lipoprotein YifL